MKHLTFWYTACSLLTPLGEGSTYWAASAAMHFAPRFYLKFTVCSCVARAFAVYRAQKGKSHPRAEKQMSSGVTRSLQKIRQSGVAWRLPLKYVCTV